MESKQSNPSPVKKEPESTTSKSLPSSPEEGPNQDAASSPEEESTAGASWWGGWVSKDVLDKAVNSVTSVVDVAKEKSNEVYGLVAKDLGEVGTQANSMVRSTSTTLKKTLEELDEKSDVMADKAYDSVKKSMTSAWRYAAGYAQQMFTEEDLEAEALIVSGDQQEPVLLDRLQAQLYALASDPDTFLSDPHPDDNLGADYASWKCNLDKRQGEISDLMVNNKNIRCNYSELVPEKVNHKAFWTRYFFKVHLIELQESRRQALKRRAEQNVKEETNWDDVGDITAGQDDQDIPDEVQDRLLSEYEKELIESKMNRAPKDDKLCVDVKQLSINKGAKSSSKTSPASSGERDETSSDDWEKLSAGEKSPKKQNKEEEEEWVQP